MLRKNKQNKLTLFFILIFMAITYETTFGALNREDKEMAQLIMPREGFRSSVYSDKDRQGIETGLAAGFGHKLTAEELKQYKVGDEIGHKQAVDWLKGDLALAREASRKQTAEIGEKGGPNVTEDFQKALQKVNFQLGPGWVQKFPTAWEHLKKGRWDQAIEEVKFTEEGSGQESKWMKQTPERAEDFTQAIQEQWEAAKVPSSPEYTEKMIDHWEIEEALEKVPKSVDLLDPAKKEENQLQIKDVVDRLGDSYFSMFYRNLIKPDSTILPEYTRMFFKNIIEEQMSGENIKPPITNKDFRPEDLESLRNILLDEDLVTSPFETPTFTAKGRELITSRPKLKEEGYSYVKLSEQPETIDIPLALQLTLGSLYFKINKDDLSISIRDIYNYNPKNFPIGTAASKVASSDVKTPGYSPGNRVEIDLPALEKEFN